MNLVTINWLIVFSSKSRKHRRMTCHGCRPLLYYINLRRTRSLTPVQQEHRLGMKASNRSQRNQDETQADRNILVCSS